jgi:hypothetical protein
MIRQYLLNTNESIIVFILQKKWTKQGADIEDETTIVSVYTQ